MLITRFCGVHLARWSLGVRESPWTYTPIVTQLVTHLRLKHTLHMIAASTWGPPSAAPATALPSWPQRSDGASEPVASVTVRADAE